MARPKKSDTICPECGGQLKRLYHRQTWKERIAPSDKYPRGYNTTKQHWKPVGWLCLQCKRVTLDEGTISNYATLYIREYSGGHSSWVRVTRTQREKHKEDQDRTTEFVRELVKVYQE